MSITETPAAGQRLARILTDELDRQYGGNQSALERDIEHRVSQPTISRLLVDPGARSWQKVREVVVALGLDVAECEALHNEARKALATSRDSGNGCFRRVSSALGDYISGILTGPLDGRWAPA